MSTSAVMGSSPGSPRDMPSSPDTTTSPFPDRPIRPLPKRRLRERLSPSAAESIKYPPAPKTTTPLFYYSNNTTDDPRAIGFAAPGRRGERERADDPERNYVSRRVGVELDSDGDEIAYRSRVYSRHNMTDNRSYRYVQRFDTRDPHPQLASAASSVDGYDSFENTNNKKKRKIPTPGDSSLNGLHLSGDLAHMGISGSGDSLADGMSDISGTYNSSVASSPNSPRISGPGRGRYGRMRNGRSPLRTLSDASSNLGNGRLSKQRQPQWAPTSEPAGIISTAIANAEKITPSRGQENVSLQQQASKRSGPAPTKFTFECETQVPGTVPWPGVNSTPIMHQSPAAVRAMATHATQTSPSMPANPTVPAVVAQAKQGLAASQQAAKPPKPNKPQPAPPKKTRRRTAAKEYDLQARQRRQQKEYQNYQHPPGPEETWVCEFCEYELIFGTPPEALVRQYEIKDRRQRKEEAERKRLLEKAKTKGRKGKKGGKAAPKSTAAPTERQAQGGQQAQQTPSMTGNKSYSQNTQSEEYYEDEYDEEYLQEGSPPASTTPAGPVLNRGSDVRHPDPGKRMAGMGGGINSTPLAT